MPKLTRRRFLATGLAGTGALLTSPAALAGTSVASTASGDGRSSSDGLSIDGLRPLVGSSFSVTTPEGRRTKMVLDKLEDGTRPTDFGGRSLRGSAFSMRFSGGGPAGSLTQGTYSFRARSGLKVSVFAVPNHSGDRLHVFVNQQKY